MTTCGDGMVAGDEECDDWNTDDDDGCSSMCAVEIGYFCPCLDCGVSMCSRPSVLLYILPAFSYVGNIAVVKLGIIHFGEVSGGDLRVYPHSR